MSNGVVSKPITANSHGTGGVNVATTVDSAGDSRFTSSLATTDLMHSMADNGGRPQSLLKVNGNHVTSTTKNGVAASCRKRPTSATESTFSSSDDIVSNRNDVILTPTDARPAFGCFSCIGRRQATSKTTSCAPTTVGGATDRLRQKASLTVAMGWRYCTEPVGDEHQQMSKLSLVVPPPHLPPHTPGHQLACMLVLLESHQLRSSSVCMCFLSANGKQIDSSATAIQSNTGGDTLMRLHQNSNKNATRSLTPVNGEVISGRLSNSTTATIPISVDVLRSDSNDNIDMEYKCYGGNVETGNGCDSAGNSITNSSSTATNINNNNNNGSNVGYSDSQNDISVCDVSIDTAKNGGGGDVIRFCHQPVADSSDICCNYERSPCNTKDHVTNARFEPDPSVHAVQTVPTQLLHHSADLRRRSLPFSRLPPVGNDVIHHARPAVRLLPIVTENDRQPGFAVAGFRRQNKCGYAVCQPADCTCANGKESRQQLVQELEAKNRAIQHEIHRIRLLQQQQQQQQPPGLVGYNQLLCNSAYQLLPAGSDTHIAQRPTVAIATSGSIQLVPRLSLVDELCHLRRRRDELECRMMALQSSRLELVSQLDELMSVLKSRSTTPSTSPRSPLPTFDVAGPALFVVSGDVQQAFAASSCYQLQQQHMQHPQHVTVPSSPHSSPLPSCRPIGVSRDLLQATDYITDAVSSLVRELNSGESSESSVVETTPALPKPDCVTGTQMPTVDFLTELRQHRLFQLADRQPQSLVDTVPSCRQAQLGNDAMPVENPEHTQLVMHQSTNRFVSINDTGYGTTKSNTNTGNGAAGFDSSGFETDQESYIRTDDDEPENAEWEEARLRWINR